MFVAIVLFICGVVAFCAGCFLALLGVSNALMLISGMLAFVVSAVLISGSFIIGAILDLEKAVRRKEAPPPLPR